MIGLDSVWLLSDTRGVKEKPTVGSEVISRIGHNLLLPARVLAIRDTGTYQVRLEHSGSILWTRSIVEVLHKRTGGGLLDTAIEFLKENGPATAGELIHIILDNGLWTPKRAGSTPRLTLYGMLYNEATKATFPRVRRLEGGLWEAI